MFSSRDRGSKVTVFTEDGNKDWTGLFYTNLTTLFENVQNGLAAGCGEASSAEVMSFGSSEAQSRSNNHIKKIKSCSNYDIK